MKRPRSHGQAMMLVLLFLVLMTSLASIAYRHVGGMLRVESARASQSIRDQGSLAAMARALALLETGTPPANPYVVGASVETATGPREYTITMTSESVGHWTLHSAPTAEGESPLTMPSTF